MEEKDSFKSIPDSLWNGHPKRLMLFKSRGFESTDPGLCKPCTAICPTHAPPTDPGDAKTELVQSIIGLQVGRGWVIWATSSISFRTRPFLL